MQLDRVCLLLLLRTFLFQRGTPDERTEGSFDLARQTLPAAYAAAAVANGRRGRDVRCVAGARDAAAWVYGVARRWLAVKARGLLGEIVWSKGLVDS